MFRHRLPCTDRLVPSSGRRGASSAGRRALLASLVGTLVLLLVAAAPEDRAVPEFESCIRVGSTVEPPARRPTEIEERGSESGLPSPGPVLGSGRSVSPRPPREAFAGVSAVSAESAASFVRTFERTARSREFPLVPDQDVARLGEVLRRRHGAVEELGAALEQGALLPTTVSLILRSLARADTPASRSVLLRYLQDESMRTGGVRSALSTLGEEPALHPDLAHGILDIADALSPGERELLGPVLESLVATARFDPRLRFRLLRFLEGRERRPGSPTR